MAKEMNLAAVTRYSIPLVVVLSLGVGLKGASAQCLYTEIGIPPDSSNNSGSVFLGEALGQTFYAEHTLIESITVWRVAWEGNSVYGMRIFVVPTDSLGHPDVASMLLAGPSVFHTDGDGVHPTAFEFVFDPPLRLPKIDYYEFAVQSDPCYGLWDILGVSGEDDYPNGVLWSHSRSIDDPCPLRKRPERLPAADLCFRIRYCDGVTPTKKSSWGQLKVLYR